MAHSGKTMTFATDLLPNEDDVYSLGSSSLKWKIHGSLALSDITGADDLKAIEALTGTSGLLKKTAANTWTLDTNSYSTTSHNHDTVYLKLNGTNNMSADVNIIAGDTDKFVNFWYNTNKTAGASWRVGMKGSGSSDTNYFTIDSGTSTTSATTWNTALQIGQNTYDIGIRGNLYPYNTATALGTSSKKWGDVYATTFKSGTWNGTQIGVTYGGTGTTIAPTQGGVIYGSSTTAYASTAAGTAGQVLKSAGTDAPEWANEYSVEIIRMTT